MEHSDAAQDLRALPLMLDGRDDALGEQVVQVPQARLRRERQ